MLIFAIGGVFSSIFSRLFGSKEYKVLILGLDSAGKTTILFKLQLGEVFTTAPTIGFNVETVQFKNIKLQVWDLGGQSSIRPWWRCYYAKTAGIVWVVDSTDVDRFSTSFRELTTMLSEEELKGVPLIVLANKQDLPDAKDVSTVSEVMQLSKISDRSWTIVKCCAITGDGLEPCMEWLTKNMTKNI